MKSESVTSIKWSRWATAGLAAALASTSFGAQALSKWQTLTPMPEAIYEPIAESINGIVYMAGGGANSDSSVSDKLFAYDPTTDTWTSKAPMPSPRFQNGYAGVINSKLYIAGGQTTGNQVTDTLFVYDPATDAWSSKAAMPHPGSSGVTSVIDSRLYVTTGDIGSARICCSRLLDVYDPATDQWTSLAPSIYPHPGAAGGVINGKLYVAGGSSSPGVLNRKTEVYDPKTNTWAALAQMPVAVVGSASAVLNGRLYVFSGYNGDPSGYGAVNLIQVYDPHTNKWSKSTSSATPPTARYGAGAAVAYGIVFIAGGTAGGGTYFSTNENFVILPSIP